MNRVHHTAILCFILSLPCLAQTEDESWLSLSRLSLSVTTGYHLNPWKNYNQAVETAARSVSADPFFIEPRGFYERIEGSGTIEALVSYRVYERVSAVLYGSYGEFEAGMEFYPDPAQLPSGRSSLAFHQHISYQQQTFGVGAQYEFHPADAFLLTIKATVDYYDADIGIRWRHNRNATGPLPENTGEHLEAELHATTYGATVSGGAQVHLWGPVHFGGQIRYRFATLKNFEGPAKFFFSSSATERPFTAELVEASNYFGVRVKDSSALVFLPPLTFLTEPDETARVPASIHLSSFGVTGGIIIRF